MRRKEIVSSIILFGPECQHKSSATPQIGPSATEILELSFPKELAPVSGSTRTQLVAEAERRLVGVKDKTLPIEAVTAQDLQALVYWREPSLSKPEIVRFFPTELRVLLGWEGNMDYMRETAEGYMAIPHHELLDGFIRHLLGEWGMSREYSNQERFVANERALAHGVGDVESVFTSSTGFEFWVETCLHLSLTIVGLVTIGYE